MASVKVHNLNGTGGRVPKDGSASWLEWWKKKTGKSCFFCSNISCVRASALGGHVQKDAADDDHWYIVPLCDACNQLTSSFSVPESDLVRLTDD